MDTNPELLTALAPHYTGKLRVRICGISIEQKKILLVRHQNPENGTGLWSPPGGGLQFGETIKDCLVREFLEETGLVVVPGRFLFMHEFLQEPLHALELFFEVQVTGGELKAGSDPELAEDAQLISEVSYKSLVELRKENSKEVHHIFQDLIDLDDIFMPMHRFI